jgi:hypothetical protein
LNIENNHDLWVIPGWPQLAQQCGGVNELKIVL